MFKLILKISFPLCILLALGSCEAACPGMVITDLNQKSCTDKATNDTAFYLDRSGCIPKCSVYPVGTNCSADPNVCITGLSCESRCGPPYQNTTCVVEDDCKQLSQGSTCGKYCVLPTFDDNSVGCMAYHSNVDGYLTKWWSAIKFKPVCDDNRYWLPKQCKGGLQGRCLCYSSTGNRLFGQALYSEATNMTCACSRKKSDLESAGRNYVTLHCDSTGNYDELQCDLEKGLCWCAKPYTGELTAPFVPSKAMKKLPCYSEDNVGDQYLRQCESQKYATAMINAKLKTHGVVTVESDTLLCDADGSYGAYTISSGIAYCTWRNNSKIGSWQANIGDMTDTLNCNCARDYYMYQHSQSCENTGNYVSLQETIDSNDKKQYYCVDADGFGKTDLFETAINNCTDYY